MSPSEGWWEDNWESVHSDDSRESPQYYSGALNDSLDRKDQEDFESEDQKRFRLERAEQKRLERLIEIEEVLPYDYVEIQHQTEYDIA